MEENLNNVIDENLNDILIDLGIEDLEIDDIDTEIDMKYVDKNCPECNGYGYLCDTMGFKIECEACYLKNRKEAMEKEREIEKQKENNIIVTNADALHTVECMLIPGPYKDKVFDAEEVRKSLTEMCNNQKYTLQGLNSYLKILNQILEIIENNEKLNSSFIISAPSGSAKATFANTCIKILHKQGKNVVPYTTLQELIVMQNELKQDFWGYNQKVNKDINLNDLKNAEDTTFKPKEPKTLASYYSFKHYLYADILFVCLSSTNLKIEESKMLKDLMVPRGLRGLPTIVFTENPLETYFRNSYLKQYIWDDLLSYSKDVLKPDRLIAVQCQKVVVPSKNK